MEPAEYERMYRLEEWHWWFVSRQQLAAALIKQYGQGRVLDVGCGTGGNLAFLSRWGEVTGLDLNPLALHFARRRQIGQLVQASGLSLPYLNQTFDMVTAFDVLYHRWVEDDREALAEIRRVLRPGGWLLITDSALPLLWGPHDEIYQARQRYTLADLRHKLDQTGFEPLISSYTNTLLLPVTLAVRFLMRWFPALGQPDLYPPARWLNYLLKQIRGLELIWLQRGGRFPVGSSLICLAQKKEL